MQALGLVPSDASVSCAVRSVRQGTLAVVERRTMPSSDEARAIDALLLATDEDDDGGRGGSLQTFRKLNPKIPTIRLDVRGKAMTLGGTARGLRLVLLDDHLSERTRFEILWDCATGK